MSKYLRRRHWIIAVFGKVELAYEKMRKQSVARQIELAKIRAKKGALVKQLLLDKKLLGTQQLAERGRCGGGGGCRLGEPFWLDRIGRALIGQVCRHFVQIKILQSQYRARFKQLQTIFKLYLIQIDYLK